MCLYSNGLWMEVGLNVSFARQVAGEQTVWAGETDHMVGLLPSNLCFFVGSSKREDGQEA
jgi:hypothetical protein